MVIKSFFLNFALLLSFSITKTSEPVGELTTAEICLASSAVIGGCGLFYGWYPKCLPTPPADAQLGMRIACSATGCISCFTGAACLGSPKSKTFSAVTVQPASSQIIQLDTNYCSSTQKNK